LAIKPCPAGVGAVIAKANDAASFRGFSIFEFLSTIQSFK
jgi:hypothetical protein